MKKKTVTIQDLKQLIIAERDSCVKMMKISERKRHVDYYAGKIHAFERILEIIKNLNL